jgi:hypothetical protein
LAQRWTIRRDHLPDSGRVVANTEIPTQYAG